MLKSLFPLVKIKTEKQHLYLYQKGRLQSVYRISSAANGLGEKMGSECTPRGWHQIKIKIGNHCPLHTVFVARRPTGEIFHPQFAKQYPQRDWILTRILWLSGLESGFNRGGDRDSLRRFIYIHGTDREDLLGQPVSHGCIRMANQDMIELFDQVKPGTRVHIE